MKSRIWAAIGAAVIIMVGALMLVRGGQFTFLGSLVTVASTTTNSDEVAIGTFSIPRGNLFLLHGGLAATNDLPVNLQVSLDGTNYLTVYTLYPSDTNATTGAGEAFSPQFSGVTIYLRASVTTTNTVTVGGSYQY